MRQLIIATAVLMVVAGCGPIALNEARIKMEQARDAYTACLARNAQNIPACDALRLAYDANVRAYDAQRGSSINVNNR